MFAPAQSSLAAAQCSLLSFIARHSSHNARRTRCIAYTRVSLLTRKPPKFTSSQWIAPAWFPLLAFRLPPSLPAFRFPSTCRPGFRRNLSVPAPHSRVTPRPHFPSVRSAICTASDQPPGDPSNAVNISDVVQIVRRARHQQPPPPGDLPPLNEVGSRYCYRVRSRQLLRIP